MAKVSGMGWASRSIVVLSACAWFGLTAGAVTAQGEERILGYDVDINIDSAGFLQVRERIDYNFGAEQRHGIIRELPIRVEMATEYTGSGPLTIRRSPSLGSATAGPSGPSCPMRGSCHRE